MDTTRSGVMATTLGLRDRASMAAWGSSATKPLRACSYTPPARPPWAATICSATPRGAGPSGCSWTMTRWSPAVGGVAAAGKPATVRVRTVSSTSRKRRTGLPLTQRLLHRISHGGWWRQWGNRTSYPEEFCRISLSARGSLTLSARGAPDRSPVATGRPRSPREPPAGLG